MHYDPDGDTVVLSGKVNLLAKLLEALQRQDRVFEKESLALC